MNLTILGGCGAWPTSDQGCGGYVLEHAGFRLLIDPGYAVLPRLLDICEVGEVDAVLVSHGHPDHCADLNPLLRARVLGGDDLSVLPVFAPKGALDQVLALDQVRSVARGAEVGRLIDGGSLELGPFTVETVMLPHHIPNAGMRITADDEIFAYTGDSGHCSDRTALAKEADLLLAEATYPDQVPPDDAPYLSSARQVAQLALGADSGLTVLTHLWPGTSSRRALAASRAEGLVSVQAASAGLQIDLAAVPGTLAGRRAAPASSWDRRPGGEPGVPRRAAAS